MRLRKKNKIIKVKNPKREPLIKLREKIYNENYKQISNYLFKINDQNIIELSTKRFQKNGYIVL